MCTAVGTQLSLSVCSTYMTCVAQQYSCAFSCVGCTYVFEPAILPHPPAFMPYKSLPSPVYTSFLKYVDHAPQGYSLFMRCGSVRCSKFRHLTVRDSVRFSNVVKVTMLFGAAIPPTAVVRFCAVLYGSVRRIILLYLNCLFLQGW